MSITLLLPACLPLSTSVPMHLAWCTRCDVQHVHWSTSTPRASRMPLPHSAKASPSPRCSYECLPGTTVVSIPHKVEIGEFDVVWGDSKEWKQRRGSSTWLFPASKGKKFTWSTYNQNIAKLRTSPTTLEWYVLAPDCLLPQCEPSPLLPHLPHPSCPCAATT